MTPRLPLFAYGTLTDEAFVAGLLERPVRPETARLLDFELLELEGFGYPTVFSAEGEEVQGVLYRGLTDEDLRRLDAYEGVGEGLYRRLTALVVAGEGEPEEAFVYLVTERTVRRFLR
ncbi:MAG TPA: gamma-glutamylcyclotransferase family protein [Thermoanaerobaculia bacterium]|nr:gamma-glutamylcyclotransferase family protein [Thermoanaerobaculia bacterium]